MKYVLIIAFLLPSLRAFAGEVCLGTQYGHPGDKQSGDVFACGYDAKAKQWGRYGGRFKKTKMSSRFFGMAHRTLSCGTMVRVCRLGQRKGEAKKKRCVVVPIVDTGPWLAGLKSRCRTRWPSIACRKTGKTLVRRVRQLPQSHKRKFVGCADLLPPAAQAIQLGGMAQVTVKVVKRRIW